MNGAIFVAGLGYRMDFAEKEQVYSVSEVFFYISLCKISQHLIQVKH